MGGEETEVNEYPWMVALVNPGLKTPWCGGSLVSAQHVLTAAHCTHGHTAASIEVLVGEHDTSDSEADRHNISAITDHPSYNHTTLDFDISVLTLAAPPLPPRCVSRPLNLLCSRTRWRRLSGGATPLREAPSPQHYRRSM